MIHVNVVFALKLKAKSGRLELGKVASLILVGDYIALPLTYPFKFHLSISLIFI